MGRRTNYSIGAEKQTTASRHGHILSHSGVWSRDGQWVVYDVRSDPLGSVFDGTRIERVQVDTGEVQVLYQSTDGACCGVATYNPVTDAVVFILGPEHPTGDWSYAPDHRRGVIVDVARPGVVRPLDARSLIPPFTPGALRGGTHLHTFSGDGRWVAFTYHDHVLNQIKSADADHDRDQRNIAISAPFGPVRVPGDHPRNHDADYFSVLVTLTVNDPVAGSDQISRASEEAWIGTNGYLKPDASRQKRAIAFQGQVSGAAGEPILEVFVVDIPDDPTIAGDGPLEGTSTRRPAPPRGTKQRRLTYTEGRKYPGLAGPRHWLQSSPDGSRIAFLMRDDNGIAQLWTISPNGGEPLQLTRDPRPVASAFTWSPDGRRISYVADNSVFAVDATTGQSQRLTPQCADESAPLPLACVFSPEGGRIAYLRPLVAGRDTNNQIMAVKLPLS